MKNDLDLTVIKIYKEGKRDAEIMSIRLAVELLKDEGMEEEEAISKVSKKYCINVKEVSAILEKRFDIL